MSRLGDGIRYIIEDTRIRAKQLETDCWFTKEEMESKIAENVFAAAVLRQEAFRLEKILKENAND